MGSVTTLVIAVVSITATALPTAKNVVIIVADDLGYDIRACARRTWPPLPPPSAY